MTLGLSPTRAVDQKSSHRFGRRAKKMGAIVKRWILISDQAQPGFMDQRGRLERLARSLMRQFGGGQAPQFIVHENEQLLRSFAVTFRNGRQHYSGISLHMI